MSLLSVSQCCRLDSARIASARKRWTPSLVGKAGGGGSSSRQPISRRSRLAAQATTASSAFPPVLEHAMCRPQRTDADEQRFDCRVPDTDDGEPEPETEHGRRRNQQTRERRHRCRATAARAGGARRDRGALPDRAGRPARRSPSPRSQVPALRSRIYCGPSSTATAPPGERAAEVARAMSGSNRCASQRA